MEVILDFFLFPFRFLHQRPHSLLKLGSFFRDRPVFNSPSNESGKTRTFVHSSKLALKKGRKKKWGICASTHAIATGQGSRERTNVHGQEYYVRSSSSNPRQSLHS